jgi:hypothetical protein
MYIDILLHILYQPEKYDKKSKNDLNVCIFIYVYYIYMYIFIFVYIYIYKYIFSNTYWYIYACIHTYKGSSGTEKIEFGTEKIEIGTKKRYSSQIPQKETLSSLLLQHTDSEFINENLGDDHRYV